LQPADHPQMITPFLGLESNRIRVSVLQGRPEFSRPSEDVFERRHYPDNGIAAVIESDLASDDCAITAEAPPERFTEDHYVGPVEAIVGGSEVSSECRRDAQDAEVICAYELSVESLGLGGTDQRRLPWLHYGECAEGTAPFRQFAIGVEG